MGATPVDAAAIWSCCARIADNSPSLMMLVEVGEVAGEPVAVVAFTMMAPRDRVRACVGRRSGAPESTASDEEGVDAEGDVISSCGER